MIGLQGVAPVVTRGPWAVWVAGAPMGGAVRLADAFLAHGVDAVGAVPGEWALVAHRAGDEHLHVAVDAFAGAPLFVRGTEARLEAVGWRGTLDPVELRQHLDADFREPWRTWIDGVWRVPAGHGGRCADPRELRSIYTPVGSTMPLREAVDRAVARRTSDDPWVALSGGLDSAVVATSLAAIGPATAITNRFDGWSCDEGVYAEAVARHANLVRHDVDSRSPAGALRVLELLAPPFFPPVLTNHHLNLALMAPGRTLFTGFGGDEVFGHGFDVVREQMSAGRPFTSLVEAVGLAVRYRHARATVPHELSRWLREWGRAGLHPSSATTLRQRRIDRFTDPLLARSREEQLRLARCVGSRLAMPLLDPEVVASVIERPASERARRGRTRLHVRHAFHDRLPAVVRDRLSKADLSDSLVGPLTCVLERNADLSRTPLLRAALSPLERDGLRRGLAGDQEGREAWLWRVISAARYLAWQTAA